MLLVAELVIAIEEFFIAILDTTNLGFAARVSIPEFLNIFFIHKGSPCLFSKMEKTTSLNLM
ncbi:MAG: hypothetical protein KAV87_39875 [Desulfobacteraceae bacterium]|nr:hypothetical protein [Desulfobacteraceae bacterium]